MARNRKKYTTTAADLEAKRRWANNNKDVLKMHHDKDATQNKKISFRLHKQNDKLAIQWLQNKAQEKGLSMQAFLREMVLEKMQQETKNN